MVMTQIPPLTFALFTAFFLALAPAPPCFAQPGKEKAADIVPTEALVINPVGRYGRNAIHLDAVEALIVAGKWQTPKAGHQLKGPMVVSAWQAAKFDQDGRLNHAALRGGYAVVPVKADAD